MCQKCESTGRKCDGYQPIGRGARHFVNTASAKAGDGRKAAKAQAVDEGISSSTPLIPPQSASLWEMEDNDNFLGPENWQIISLPRNSLLNFPGSMQEHRSYEFFRWRTAPALSGYFDSRFWNEVLPRIGASEAPVKHAMIALASLSEYCTHNDGYTSVEQQQFTLLQYNKAIKSLKGRLNAGEQALDVTLLTCILFICLEFMRGNPEIALDHLQSGLQILSRTREARSLSYYPGNATRVPSHSDCIDSELIEEEIVQIFSRLSIQASLNGRQPPQLYRSERNITIEDSQSASTPFKNVNEARLSLDRLQIESLKAADPHINSSSTTDQYLRSDRDNLLMQLRFWICRYGLFMADSIQNLSLQEIYGLRLLRIASVVSIIWNSTAKVGEQRKFEETAFDEHLSQFETLITLATSVIEDSVPSFLPSSYSSKSNSESWSILTGNTTPETLTPSSDHFAALPNTYSPSSKHRSTEAFTFEMGIIPFLYFTAIKCRSPTVRRAAIHLLSKATPQREGLWDARLMANIAKRMMEIEEDGCSPTSEPRTWPPEQRRVHGAYFFEGSSSQERIQEVKFVWRPTDEFETWVENIEY